MNMSQTCICAGIYQHTQETFWRREMRKIWKLSLLSAQSPPKLLVNLGQWLLLNTLNFVAVRGNAWHPVDPLRREAIKAVIP